MGYLRLMRPANIVTAISDIIAGVAISGYFLHDDWQFEPVGLLVLSTIGLYGGGVVMNDYFDADLDKIERPERPIPSGLVSKTEALVLGMSLLIMGIVAAAFVNEHVYFSLSTLFAVAIAIAALVYDAWGKHQPVLGPVNMGLCRGLNLLLGMTVRPETALLFTLLALVPIIYIAAITMVSRGEVHGGRKKNMYAAASLYVLAIAGVVFFSYKSGNLLNAIAFILLWAALIFPPLQKAIAKPEGKQIGMAVKAGVIALIVMNASWVAAYSTVYYAIIIVLLLPVSILLARLFAVT